MHQLE